MKAVEVNNIEELTFYNTSRTVSQETIIQILPAKFQHAIISIKVGKIIRKSLIEKAYITTPLINFSVDLNPNFCTVVQMVLNYRGYMFIIGPNMSYIRLRITRENHWLSKRTILIFLSYLD